MRSDFWSNAQGGWLRRVVGISSGAGGIWSRYFTREHSVSTLGGTSILDGNLNVLVYISSISVLGKQGTIKLQKKDCTTQDVSPLSWGWGILSHLAEGHNQMAKNACLVLTLPQQHHAFKPSHFP